MLWGQGGLCPAVAMKKESGQRFPRTPGAKSRSQNSSPGVPGATGGGLPGQGALPLLLCQSHVALLLQVLEELEAPSLASLVLRCLQSVS